MRRKVGYSISSSQGVGFVLVLFERIFLPEVPYMDLRNRFFVLIDNTRCPFRGNNDAKRIEKYKEYGNRHGGNRRKPKCATRIRHGAKNTPAALCRTTLGLLFPHVLRNGIRGN
jgi:hypothetical protein